MQNTFYVADTQLLKSDVPQRNSVDNAKVFSVNQNSADQFPQKRTLQSIPQVLGIVPINTTTDNSICSV